MTGVRTFEVDDCAADLLVAAKGDRTVSVCIPCRDEAATIGPLVSVIRAELMGTVGIVDELIVLDDRSTDDTARVAAHAGARVVSIDDVHAAHGTGHGKGNALWATLLVSHGDFVVWCDGDVTSFEPDWVVQTAVAAARRRLGGAGEGAVPPADPVRRRRPDDRAGRPTVDVDVLPGADRPRPAAVGRVRRPPIACSSGSSSSRAGVSRWRC